MCYFKIYSSTANGRPQRSPSAINLRSHFIPAPFHRLYTGSYSYRSTFVVFFSINLTYFLIFFKNNATDHVSHLSSGAFCRHNRTFKRIWYCHGGRDSIVVLLIANQQDEQSSNNGSIPRRHFTFFATSWPALGPTQTTTHWYQLRWPRG